jgi:hypothetical protein
MAAPGILFGSRYWQLMGSGLVGADPAMFSQLALLWLALMLFTFLGIAMILVAVTREALGLREGPAYFYFSLDAAFWTLLASLLLRSIIFAAALFALILGGAALAAGAVVAGGTAGAAVAGLILTVLWLVAFPYVAFRLWFFAVPLAVAEQRIGIGRGWQLAKGNFWRMFVVSLALMIPIMIVYVVALQLLLGDEFFPRLDVEPGPDAQAAMQAQMQAWQARFAERMQAIWYILYPLGMVLGVLFYGVSTAAVAYAYRALVPMDKRTTAEVFS